VTQTQKAAEAFVKLGFEVAVLDNASTPHVGNQAYFTEFTFGIPDDRNLAIRSARRPAAVTTLCINRDSYPDAYKCISGFGRTLEIECGPNSYSVFEIDPAFVQQTEGDVLAGDLRGTTLLTQGVLAFGKIWGSNNITDVKCNFEKPTPLPEELAKMLVLGYRLTLTSGVYS
jgi:hypothetical protein